MVKAVIGTAVALLSLAAAPFLFAQGLTGTLIGSVRTVTTGF